MTTLSPDELRARLAAYLAAQTGEAVDIPIIMPLAGGASRDSWMFSAQFNDTAPQKFVLRRDLPTTMNDQALTRPQEFAVMQVAHQHGVKVARVRWLCEDTAVLGLPFFIMDFVEGISVGRKVMTAPDLAHARTVLPQQMAEQLALIHRLPIETFDFLPRPMDDFPVHHNPATQALYDVHRVLKSLNHLDPTFEYLLRWCQWNTPTKPEKACFIHGDFRIGNLLINPTGLAAVIDWEFAHIGDPHEELGYLCMRDWRFGMDKHRAAGLCPRETFIQAYESYAHQQVNRDAVTWWEILGNIRWAAICLVQAQRHLSGQDQSVELASLGRRSLEMQAEALRLVKQEHTNLGRRHEQ